MTHVVTEACIRCTYKDCVEVCPTDCFREGENMLVIDPETCIDCGVCVLECPVSAIVPDTDPKALAWLEDNNTYAALWPKAHPDGVPPLDADAWRDIVDKRKFLSPRPARNSF